METLGGVKKEIVILICFVTLPPPTPAAHKTHRPSSPFYSLTINFIRFYFLLFFFILIYSFSVFIPAPYIHAELVETQSPAYHFRRQVLCKPNRWSSESKAMLASALPSRVGGRRPSTQRARSLLRCSQYSLPSVAKLYRNDQADKSDGRQKKADA